MPFMFSEMQNKLSKTRELPMESMGQIISSGCPIRVARFSLLVQPVSVDRLHTVQTTVLKTDPDNFVGKRVDEYFVFSKIQK